MIPISQGCDLGHTFRTKCDQDHKRKGVRSLHKGEKGQTLRSIRSNGQTKIRSYNVVHETLTPHRTPSALLCCYRLLCQMFLTMFWSTVNQRAQNSRTFFTLRSFDEPYQKRKMQWRCVCEYGSREAQRHLTCGTGFAHSTQSPLSRVAMRTWSGP